MCRGTCEVQDNNRAAPERYDMVGLVAPGYLRPVSANVSLKPNLQKGLCLFTVKIQIKYLRKPIEKILSGSKNI